MKNRAEYEVRIWHENGQKKLFDSLDFDMNSIPGTFENTRKHSGYQTKEKKAPRWSIAEERFEQTRQVSGHRMQGRVTRFSDFCNQIL